MTVRLIAAALAAASLGVLPRPASAQGPDAPAPQTRAAPHAAAKPAKARARRAAKPMAEVPAVPSAGANPITGGGAEASSLERRRKAFFAKPPDEGTAGGDAPSAGVTLGGSGGLSPGMGFKF